MFPSLHTRNAKTACTHTHAPPQEAAVLRIELTAMYLLHSKLLDEFSAQFPPWTTVTPGTTYHRDWEFALPAGAVGGVAE